MAQADGGESSADGGGGELIVLVFNLGGGTCDASLILLDAGILEVRLCRDFSPSQQRSRSILSPDTAPVLPCCCLIVRRPATAGFKAQPNVIGLARFVDLCV